MQILVVGSGGREHALAWRLAQSERADLVYVAPGNAGTAFGSKLKNVPLSKPEELADFVAEHHIDLTLVGPEAPLAAGIVDLFRSRGLKIFGPTKAAAQLESSKDFAKAFMKRHGIPTADYETFTDAAAAHDYVSRKGAPIVIKADGLAAGKGVIVAMTADEAHAAIDSMLEGNKFGAAGSRVVIEQYLEGEEASFIVMSDGQHILPLASSQDHKRLLDGDVGPNTGGMGAYSPAPIVTPEMHAQVMRQIITPTIQGMAKDGIPYTGFLYAGLMISKDASGKAVARTLEFNCRMGDPETQPIMSRIRSDFVTILEAACNGRLDEVEIDWDHRVALGVVCAAKGYPESPRKGDLISSLPADTDDVHVFHAGTKLDGQGNTVTSGGRVLCVVALDNSVSTARTRVYDAVSQVRFDGMQYRKDIGHRALSK